MPDYDFGARRLYALTVLPFFFVYDFTCTSFGALSGGRLLFLDAHAGAASDNSSSHVSIIASTRFMAASRSRVKSTDCAYCTTKPG